MTRLACCLALTGLVAARAQADSTQCGQADARHAPKLAALAIEGCPVEKAVRDLAAVIQSQPASRQAVLNADELGQSAPLLPKKDAEEALKALGQALDSTALPEANRQVFRRAKSFLDDPCSAYWAVTAPDEKVSDSTRADLAKSATPGVVAACSEALLERAQTFQGDRDAYLARDRQDTALPTVKAASVNDVRPDPREPDAYIRELHHAYKNLKGWEKLQGDAQSKRAIEELRDSTHALMESRGLRSPILAEFVTGFVRTNVADGGGAPAGAQEQDATVPAGHIAWSTRHFGRDTESRTDTSVDVSVGGHLGFVPALALVEPKDAPQGGVSASYQEAFVWDLEGRLHVHAQRNFELVALGRAGQTLLNSDSTLIQTKSDPDGYIAVPLSGGEARWFYEAGLTARFHVQSLQSLHEQNGLVAPAFEASAGFKWDHQFEAAQGQVAFADPTKRKFFRFMISGVPVRGVPPDEKDKKRLFTLGFGVEHEWGSEGAPQATRFLIKGNVELLKALRGDR